MLIMAIPFLYLYISIKETFEITDSTKGSNK